MVRVKLEGKSAGEPVATGGTRTACVYTTLIGGYEKLNEQPVAASSRLPFICLTDDPKLRSKTWQIRHVEPLFGLDPIRSQRVLKLRPHEYLSSFDCSLYIDNSISLKTPPEQLIEEYLGASVFSLPEHSHRESVLDEFLEVQALGLDDQGRIFEQLNHYMLESPGVLQEKPFWTAVMLRDHRDLRVRTMLEIWLAHVQRYSRRDQLSVNFAFRRAGIRPEVLRIDNFASWFHSWPHRTNSRRGEILRLASTFLSLPMAKVKELERQNETLSTHKNRLEQTLAEERLENERMRAATAQLAELTQALTEQKLHNQALLSSTSWRMTAPIRVVIDASPTLKRLAQRALRRDARVRTSNGVVEDPARTPAERIERPKAVTSQVPELASPEAAAFFGEGFIGPVDLFTRPQCELILNHYRLGAPPVAPEWPKGRAASDRFFYDLATRPRLMEQLRPLLGEDIILWGASIIERTPGQTHVWHTDIESFAAAGRFVSVWVGLENTSRDSALQLISRSHEFGKPIQQEVYERGLRRGEATNEMVTAWAREHDNLAAFVQPEMSDGQALLLDGRLWHASHNTGNRPRSALLLQYAAAETPIVIPVFNHVEWPFRFTSANPPSVLASGKSKSGNIMLPPSACPPDALPISTHVHSGDGFLESPDGWIPYSLLYGPTPLLAAMESHVSVLSPGHSPHPPHCHVEEELLIVLKGEAQILIAEGPDPSSARVECLVPGSFVYYPAYQYHTIRNVSACPVTYLMFKWQAAPAEADRPLQTKIFDIGTRFAEQNSDPMSMRVLFEAPTAYLNKLHAHVTDLQPGAGYPAHSDEHDVAIVVFSGLVETLGKAVGMCGSIYYSAGEPHGMRNVGSEAARYLVFEFHKPRLQ